MSRLNIEDRVRRLEQQLQTRRGEVFIFVPPGEAAEDVIAAHMAARPDDRGKRVTTIRWMTP